MFTSYELREILAYDPETGRFTWRVARSRRVKVGDRAGSPGSQGYIQIKIFRRLYKAHRLAWLYVHGQWPAEQLDHINGDKTDNRIANLRPATNSQNNANKRLQRNNTSGFRGVFWHHKNSKWQAKIGVNGRQQSLGYFSSKEAAAEAYERAAERYFGEFYAK